MTERKVINLLDEMIGDLPGREEVLAYLRNRYMVDPEAAFNLSRIINRIIEKNPHLVEILATNPITDMEVRGIDGSTKKWSSQGLEA